MMENTWYSVISPEGCAAILYRDAANAPQAADAMKLAPQDLLQMGVIDRIIEEPPGGAHSDFDQAAAILKNVLKTELNDLIKLEKEELVRKRIEKYSKMGAWSE